MLCITDCCNLLLPFQLGLYLSRMILKHVTALSACKAMIRQGPSRRSASPAEGLSISDMCRLCFSSGVQSLPATRWQPVLSSRCSSSEYRGGWFCRRSLEGISRQVVWQRALLTKGPTGTKTQINNNGSQPHYKGRSQLVKHQQVWFMFVSLAQFSDVLIEGWRSGRIMPCLDRILEKTCLCQRF